jgi:hypothetical protein
VAEEENVEKPSPRQRPFIGQFAHNLRYGPPKGSHGCLSCLAILVAFVCLAEILFSGNGVVQLVSLFVLLAIVAIGFRSWWPHRHGV